jgi:hypothetical protein
MAHEATWAKIPRRYGDFSDLYQRWTTYLNAGELDRMLRALQGIPEAGITSLSEKDGARRS